MHDFARPGRLSTEVPSEPSTWSSERRARFWDKVGRSERDACWPWLGRSSPKGFGRFSIRISAKRIVDVYAHRAAWILTNGPLLEGLEVFHLCHALGCVNPKHLRTGTPLDRVQQVKAKGRVPAGEAHHAAKVTAQDVAELRALKAARPGVRAADVAPEVGLSPTRVQAIWRGEGWKPASR